MSDIVARLRKGVLPDPSVGAVEAKMNEAADEIRQLRADYEIQMRATDVAEAKVERLQAALQEIADWDEVDECAQWGIELARRALEERKG